MRTRSPFPGMDPWLESYWGEIHHRLISNFADQIQEQLPQGLIASIEVTVYISDQGTDLGNVIPDVAVLDSAPAWSEQPASGSGLNTAVAAPYRIKLPTEPIEEGHVVIRSLKDSKAVVTVIEVLSRTNKVDRRGRRAYFAKREEYYRGRANLVEIDLLRSGAELIDVPFDELPERLFTPYKAAVRRARPRDDTEAEYYAFLLQQPLPRIAVPLRPADQDVVLDLQLAIDEAYRRGKYGEQIDYTRPPSPPLLPEDAAWANQLISASQ